MPHTLGQKIKTFLFTSPTEETVGLPPAPTKKMTKSEEPDVIHHALEHPLGEPHPQQQQQHKDHPEEQAHKTWGKKVKDFLFEVPTEETIGLAPPPKDHHHHTKSEDLKEIHYALEHPFSGKVSK